MKRYLYYFAYVLRHKWFVFWAGASLGVPIWRLLIHDWDKFLPSMFIPYARRFRKSDGTRPNPLPELTTEFKRAVLSHVHRHKHHWQYWAFYDGTGNQECLAMDDVFRREMLADWIGTGRAHNDPDTHAWYLDNQDNIMLHSETRNWVEEQLDIKN